MYLHASVKKINAVQRLRNEYVESYTQQDMNEMCENAITLLKRSHPQPHGTNSQEGTEQPSCLDINKKSRICYTHYGVIFYKFQQSELDPQADHMDVNPGINHQGSVSQNPV
ncbi:hypothetical protein RF11_09305 [Thelohanellus kitauei]|uniref:Uncharacterized protein n=1 Tax=Thelohanellus kitauei TaxID=669202 RepID=A0A0C2MKG8_THEKT|nr:hypothetical protein RF11_09305 [Thelohanellus kitauei]